MITDLTVVGGFGLAPQVGERVSVGIADSALLFFNGSAASSMSYTDLLDIEIAGGATTSGTRIIGGGFGLSGALEGMLIASAINSLTRRTKINSFVRIASMSGEVALHHGALMPSQLRELLGPAVHAVAVRRAGGTQVQAQSEPASDPVSQLERLATLRTQGVLSEDEFIAVKARILGSG